MLIAVTENICIVAKGKHLDIYVNLQHKVLEIPHNDTQDSIIDISLSPDNKYFALLTSSSKRLLVYTLPAITAPTTFYLPRSASKLRFSDSNKQILIADKSGDVLIYNINKEGDKGTKLLGHLSLLLDVLLADDCKHIITCDRDEKIRVSCYPNTYNIETYCLGHKEFVKKLELLPHNKKYLASCSGDGTIKLWNYINGELCLNIDTNLNVDDKILKESFTESMVKEGVEVFTLPIVHFTLTSVSKNTSIIATMLYNFKKILLYSIYEENNTFKYKFEDNICLERCPVAIQFHKSFLYVYDDINNTVLVYSMKITDKVCFELVNKIEMFESGIAENKIVESDESIKVLYKRKFDNLQEYLERKKQRLDKK